MAAIPILGTGSPLPGVTLFVLDEKHKSQHFCWLLNNVAATYSPGCNPSTIGAAGLNFSVRDGKRWDPCARPPSLAVPGTKYNVPCIPITVPSRGKYLCSFAWYFVLGTWYFRLIMSRRKCNSFRGSKFSGN